MALQSDIDSAGADIQAQIAALRTQLDKLVHDGTAAAAGIVRDARRATATEFDTVVSQARNEPVASAVFAIGGAFLGFLLGRMCR
jgi:F0F1-type ATP synthase membrane subunit b/b'